uniref:AIR9-like A9 domain-containing protein n=1 Tax=Cajanus cajan TaxID=3821 RepID=A0A151QMS3_CAJCA|nr:hypothetical protein KK1_047988 [Cajanus cajan]
MDLVIPDCYEDIELIPLRKYFGGHEGVGEYIWYRTNHKLEGSELLDISNAFDVVICGTELTYKPLLKDVGAYLSLYWVPTRADGKCGEPLIAICSTPVSPELPYVEMLALTGKAVEGDVLTAVEVIPNSETQHVWSKYKKDIRYQWFSSSEVGDNFSYDPLPNQSSRSYKVRLEDIGHHLKCECTVTDVFGRSGEAVCIETTPVLPGNYFDYLSILCLQFYSSLHFQPEIIWL